MAFNIHSNLMVGVCVFGAGGITVPILFIYLFKLFIYLFIYLFYGCVGSLFPCKGFL